MQTRRALRHDVPELIRFRSWLSFPLLLIAAVALGAAQPLVAAVRMLLVGAVVPTEQLTRALTQDEVKVSGAELAGPPLGGALYGIRALAHATPFLFTAGSLVLSVLSALLVKLAPGTAAEPCTGACGQDRRPGMLAGITAIWGNRGQAGAAAGPLAAVITGGAGPADRPAW